jgi:hypothetical protein
MSDVTIYENCVRYLRRKRVTQEMTESELAAKAKFFEYNIGADAGKMLAASKEPGPIDGYPHGRMSLLPSTESAKP